MKPLRLAVLLLILSAGLSSAFAQQLPATPAQTLELWPALPPGAGTPHAGRERMVQNGSGAGAVSKLTRPRIEIYHPAQPNGTAVLIIGGGGYAHIDIDHEAWPAAQWLAARGVTPVILYYRLPADGWAPAAPFQDAQRAMRLLRAHAQQLGIDPHRIGVLGFSAGGNLAGITATRFGDAFYPSVDAADQQSSRPDFAALIYPVISLQAPFNSTRSSRELSAQPDAASAYSVELHVSRATPPTFLAQAADDPIANIGNSLLMFDALHKQNVPVELHVFERGGHGWGLGQPGTLVAAWPPLFVNWAHAHGFLPTTAGIAAADGAYRQ